MIGDVITSYEARLRKIFADALGESRNSDFFGFLRRFYLTSFDIQAIIMSKNPIGVESR